MAQVVLSQPQTNIAASHHFLHQRHLRQSHICQVYPISVVAQLKFNGAPVNDQGNLDRYVIMIDRSEHVSMMLQHIEAAP